MRMKQGVVLCGALSERMATSWGGVGVPGMTGTRNVPEAD